MNDTAPDTTSSSAITSHAFQPRGKWWSVCKVCGLAEAAHKTTTLNETDITEETETENV